MTTDLLSLRLDELLRVPHELRAYERWLEAERRGRGERDYLFLAERARFEPRRGDRVVVAPGTTVGERDGSAVLRCAEPRLELPVPGASRAAATALLGAIDGQRCLLEARFAAGLDAQTTARVLRAAFGRLIFAPDAVTDLEAALSATEIVRFPSSPYNVERPYWENMVAVSSRLDARRSAALPVDAFVRLLRELHVCVLLGHDLATFYRPASPVADRLVAPGALYDEPVHLHRGRSGLLLLDGPRVHAPLLGGEAYHRALAVELGDPEALAAERACDEDGVPWGTSVVARSERDEAPVPCFCPPRPLRAEHFAWLGARWQEALQAEALADRGATCQALARFHRGFVRLHPFHCANQSLAMGMVNSVLRRSHGAGIPHLLLDHLALRFSGRAYEQLFARAVAAWSVAGLEPADKLRALRERRRQALGLIEQLAAQDPARAHHAVRDADADAARWALLRG